MHTLKPPPPLSNHLFFQLDKPPTTSLTLYKGDALNILPQIEDESCDLIFADPPYFLSGGGITCKSGKMETVNKGSWDAAKNLDSIHSFNLDWIKHCQQKLQPNGTIFISGTYHNIYSIGFALQTLGFKILNDISWFKVNPPPNLSCKYFTHSTEQIIWAKKSEKAQHTFNYEAMKEADDPKTGKQMLSLWSITPPKKSEKKFGKHPTQKPLALLERIVLASTKPHHTVLDPFLGSGTTGVAALTHGRRFIGIEQEQEYLDMAKERMLEALKA